MVDYCSNAPDKIGSIIISDACKRHDKDYWVNDDWAKGWTKIKADLKLGWNIFKIGIKYFLSSLLVILAAPIYMLAVLIFAKSGRIILKKLNEWRLK